MSDDTPTSPQPPYSVQVPQPYRNTPFETLPPAIQQQIRGYGGSSDEVEPGATESADETEAMAEATRLAGEQSTDVPPPGSTSQAAMSGLIDVPGLNQADDQSDTAAQLDAGRENAGTPIPGEPTGDTSAAPVPPVADTDKPKPSAKKLP